MVSQTLKPTDALHENGFYWVETATVRPVVLEWRDGQFNGVRPYQGHQVNQMLDAGTMWIAGPLPCPFRLKNMNTEDMLDYEEEE